MSLERLRHVLREAAKGFRGVSGIADRTTTGNLPHNLAALRALAADWQRIIERELSASAPDSDELGPVTDEELAAARVELAPVGPQGDLRAALERIVGMCDVPPTCICGRPNGLPAVVACAAAALAAEPTREPDGWIIVFKSGDVTVRSRRDDVEAMVKHYHCEALPYRLIGAAPAPADTREQEVRCVLCGHAPHEPGRCLNMASDNDCNCGGAPADMEEARDGK